MAAPRFPYPSDEWIGQPSDDPRNHSGCYGGADSGHVKDWQKGMGERGYKLEADGCYGPKSEDACRDLQKDRKLTVDGDVGPKTWGETFEDSAREEQWRALWKSEKTTCQEFTGLRAIHDWEGFTEGQDDRRAAAKAWLSARVSEIKAGKHHDDDKGQDDQRIKYMQAVLDGYSDYPWTVPGYPREDATDTEAVMIKERAYYCSLLGQGKTDNEDAEAPPYEAQADRKAANYNWLKDRQNWLEDCAQGEIEGQPPGWDEKARRQRYDNVNIALHWGETWEKWKQGDYVPRDERGGDWREKSGKWHEDHLGITESPADSNCDSRSDGIRHAQDTCANGTWLRYQPWCGVWTFMGLYQSGKVASGTDSWMASVASIEDYARQARGPFRGWTSDGSKAKKGDLVVLFGRGQHVGTVRSVDSAYCHTWEGNTSSGSGGSQSNGGGSYKRSRSRSSETYGYALVRD